MHRALLGLVVHIPAGVLGLAFVVASPAPRGWFRSRIRNVGPPELVDT
jgi:hypothetical protein